MPPQLHDERVFAQ